MNPDAKLAADTLRKMADFKQMLVFPYDTGKIINACADLIESLAAELEQVKRERDGLSIMLTAAESAAETHKRERDELDAKCRQLEARNDTLIAKEVLFDEAIAAGAKMQREQDAAVEDLKLWYCFSCNNQSTPHCQECSRNRVRLAKGYLSGRDHYEWRGVKED